MPWFEAHDTMGRHPKTLKLAEILKIKRREAVGLLHDLFAWGLFAAQEDGELVGMTEFQIGLALDCETKKAAQKVVGGLLESGFLDQDERGVYYIHDWYDYAGRYCEGRNRNKEKMKAYRAKKKAERNTAKSGNCNGNVTVTEAEQTPDCNTDVTGQPIPYLNLNTPTSYDKQEEDYNILPRTGAKTPDKSPSSAPRKSAALAYYCQRINATPSSESLALIERYEAEMGADVCKLAMDRAIDEQIPKWSYINGILRSWSSAGVKSLADVRAMDARHKQRGQGGSSGRPPGKQQGRSVTDEFLRIAEEDGAL